MDATRKLGDKEKAVRRATWGRLVVLVVSGALLVLVGALAFQVSELSSISMSPTLLPGDSVLVNRLVYFLHPPRRGDIIVFHFPQTGGQDFVKRVIGVPGDVVQEQAERLAVNDVVVDESRTALSDPAPAPSTIPRPKRVPADNVWVLGDNWRTSLDSRFWGPVDEREVVGKAILICWSRGAHWWDVHWNRIGRWLE
jgi:signal peptidase I